jgi:GNAT superfamily N-acetyltransferase
LCPIGGRSFTDFHRAVSSEAARREEERCRKRNLSHARGHAVTGYEFVSHAEIDNREWLLESLASLNELTFGHYDGVVASSPAFMEWYTARPGMDPTLCQAGLTGDSLVSSLFVTLARMRLDKELLVCGIVDTVMTHPDHRRRGLARGLLDRAIAGMREAGADLSLLYTAVADPPAVPQRLYEGLGYSTCELVDRFVKPPPHARECEPAVRVMPHVEVRREFETRLGGRSGWLALDDALWAWRRIDHPSDYTVEVYRTPDDTLAAICTGRLLSGGRPRSFAVMSDLAPRGGRITADAIWSLLCAAPDDATATVLCPRSDISLAHALEAAGYRAAGTEAAMLLPLSEAAKEQAASRSSPWYVAVESIVGV